MRHALALLLLPLLLAADWPQWLGPSRDGQSTETGLAAGWAGLEQVWKVPGGLGYSSLTVADGAVYTMADRGEDQIVLKLDAATGEELWTARVDDRYKDAMSYHGPRSTPTVAGDTVVSLSGNGMLVALHTATGTVKWQLDLVETLGSTSPTWGYSGSPLVDDGKIYLVAGGSKDHGLLALSLATGAVLWKQGRYGVGYSSPVRMTLDGIDQVIFFASDQAVAVLPEDGRKLWSQPWSTSYNVNAATPLQLGPDLVFISSGYGHGGAALRFDAEKGTIKELWKTKRMKNKLATSVLLGDTIYGFNEEKLTAVSAKSGEELWSHKGYGRGTLLAADNHLIVYTERCQLALVEADATTLKQVGEIKAGLTGEPCWSAPAIANGMIYARDGAEITAWRLGTP